VKKRDRWGFGVLALLLPCLGCSGTETVVHSSEPVEKPAVTLLLGSVPCFADPEVASGGLLVRRATGMGPAVAQQLDLKLSTRGDVAPPLSADLCRELTDAAALDPSRLDAPRAPAILAEVTQMADADAAMLPVVHTIMNCHRGDEPWIWGQPAYENDSGEVDCVEQEVVITGFLFGPGGQLEYKTVHRHTLERPIAVEEVTEAFMQQAPLQDAAVLGASAVGGLKR